MQQVPRAPQTRSLNTNAKHGLVVIWTEQPNIVEVGMDLQRATVIRVT